ncbi:MAG: HAD-IIIA family hydrolase [Bacteroidales bacterium]|nr:HAD-IIIA family hydrolase [Bacteroidales bacterium]
MLASGAETLFLDRDGVLNRLLKGTYVKSWADWQWMPGILQALPLWAAKFRNIVLVTNQRGVGKGEMTDADLAGIHARMMQEILEAGGRMDLVLTCTAVSDDDPRRKPNPGMFREACALLPSLNPQRCVMVGDSDSDAAFARNAGIAFIRLLPEAVS